MVVYSDVDVLKAGVLVVAALVIVADGEGVNQ